MKKLKYFLVSFIGECFKVLKKDLTSNSITVFCYHDVSLNPSDFSSDYGLNVPPDVFEFQINFINQNFNIIGPDELLTNRIPNNAALITFDDGFKSYFNTAMPIMEKYSIPSIIFLNMAPVKGDIFWSGLITYLCDKTIEFSEYIKNNTDLSFSGKSQYLCCSEENISSYLRFKGKNFKDEVDKFVGNFADLNYLKAVIGNDLVFFGNHLYNHYVSILLTDKELLEYYNRNEDELKCYSNYRNLFSFPFGQPGTCFSEHQIELLLNNGAQKIFSSYPLINFNVNSNFFHRIPLYSHNISEGSIWFNILRKYFYI